MKLKGKESMTCSSKGETRERKSGEIQSTISSLELFSLLEVFLQRETKFFSELVVMGVFPNAFFMS